MTVERVVHEWAYVESSVGGGGEALVDATRCLDGRSISCRNHGLSVL